MGLEGEHVNNGLEEQIERQRARNDIYSRALNKIVTASYEIVSVSRAILGEHARTETPISPEHLTRAYSESVHLYRIICTIMKKHKPQIEEDDDETDTGTRLNLEMILQDINPIPESQYLLRPEEDARMELNRLRIIGVIYDTTYKKLSSQAAVMRYAGSEIEKTEYKALQDKYWNFITQVSKIHELASEGKCIMTNGIPMTRGEYAPLMHILDSVEKVVRQFYRQHKIELEMNIDSGITNIHGDEQEIKQALLNILMAKAHPLRKTENPKVTLGCSRCGDNIVMYITDNGPNIPHKDEHMIFEPARNVTLEDRNYYNDIAESTIERYGGEVCVKNWPPSGVRLRITLPAN